MDLTIREQRLPGIGHRYELSVDPSRRLVVVVGHTGRCELGVMEIGADQPNAVVSLSHEQALAVAALLTGARFSIDTSQNDAIPTDEIAVETITLGPYSPAVGLPVDDVLLPEDSEAEILAIIRDQSPELVEDDPIEPCHAGDRVVVTARRDRLPELVQQLAG